MISYFLILNKRRRVFKFIGLCTKVTLVSQHKFGGNFLNRIKGEDYKIFFDLRSPSILAIKEIQEYGVRVRTSKMLKVSNKNYISKEIPEYDNQKKFKIFDALFDETYTIKKNIKKIRKIFRLKKKI